MALENIGYNVTFDAFVEFAKTQEAAGKGKAVARVDVSDLGGIVKRNIKPGTGDWVGVGAGRLASLKRANNITREAFRTAVANLFGGEAHIPDSVKAAMKLEDYGKGKPLTARRILAVKAAIDADGTYDQLLATFGSEESENAAKAKGWSAAELPKLARAASFLSSITDEDELESIERLSTPGSKENRLLNYGGRFLENAASFREGLRFLDAFAEWFTGVNDALEKNVGARGERREGMSRTLLNASRRSFSPPMLRGTEKFVFECIAHDPSFNLAETDAEKLFGMRNNVATHFFGRHLNNACTQTVAQIPPEKRKTFFSAVTLFFPVVDNAADANIPGRKRGEPSDHKMVIARVLKHLDEIAELEARGELTFANVARIVVPELPPGSECGFAEVGKALSDVVKNVAPTLARKRLNRELLTSVYSILQETGCSMDEAIEAASGGTRPPLVPYMATGTFGLEAFDGTTQVGRKELEIDLGRPTGYSDLKRGKAPFLPEDKLAFTFNFPGEGPIATNATEQGRKNIGTVIGKIESLCGKTRTAQASSVMAMVSQSALAALRGGLSIYGIETNEHGACDFTLSKNDETGDVTIKYSSPEGLPFEFEWTATVRPDGFVTTTPLRFTDTKMLNDLGISGKAAKEIADIVLPGSGLTDIENPGEELKRRMNGMSTANLQTYASRSIATMRTGGKGSGINLDKYASAFKEDLDRKFNVTIGTGRPLHELGAEKARDEYVAFITDGKVKTYADADKKTKTKACLLMAFSCQGLVGCGLKSVSNAFDKNGNIPRLMAGMGSNERNRTDSLNLSKDENGNFVIKSSTVFSSTSLSLTKENNISEFYSTKGGGSLKYDFNVVVTAESLERFAGADWEDFDSEAIWKIENNGEVPHSVENAADALPEEFKLDVKTELSFHVNADRLAVAV